MHLSATVTGAARSASTLRSKNSLFFVDAICVLVESWARAEPGFEARRARTLVTLLPLFEGEKTSTLFLCRLCGQAERRGARVQAPRFGAKSQTSSAARVRVRSSCPGLPLPFLFRCCRGCIRGPIHLKLVSARPHHPIDRNASPLPARSLAVACASREARRPSWGLDGSAYVAATRALAARRVSLVFLLSRARSAPGRSASGFSGRYVN